MWLCEGKLKVKIAHFQLTSASQKRAYLSSLLSVFHGTLRFLQEMKYIRDALLPVLMSCATSAGNVKTLEEFLNQVSYWPPQRRRFYWLLESYMTSNIETVSR